MTAIRKSYLIAVEKEFGTGIPENDNEWWPVPQGFYLSHGSSTQANSMYGTGAKIRQNTIYGVFQGSWSASFVMDFNHLEFLSMLFDQDDNGNRSGVSTEEQRKEMFNFDTGKSGVYEHVFRKVNNRRQKSYVIKERVLNIIAGGLYDEENILKGVLAKNLQIARSISGSQMAVEMSGVFADKKTTLSPEMLDSFFVPIDDPLTQYSCMYMGANSELTDEDAVEQLDSHSINLETGVSLVYTTCSPIATDFFEDKTTFSWNATAYMNNPTKKFKLLANSGGTLNPKVGNSFKTPDGHHSTQPMGKNLAPLEYANFITYDESYRDEYQKTHRSIVEAFNESEHSVWIRARNSTVKTSSTPKGDGSKLQDSLSSVECDEIIIRIRNKKEKVWDDTNKYSGSTEDKVAKFRYSISSPTITYDFKLPLSGFVGQILGYVYISPSDTELDEPIVLNGDNGTPNLLGFSIANPELKSYNPANEYQLDNLVPKQLTKAGDQPTGELNVSVYTPDNVPCIKISGTPSIVRTDYYFIIKEDTTSSGTEPTYTMGYLCVTVR